MALEFKTIVKPSDFNFSHRLCGSSLSQTEIEVVASNVIIISKENGDRWFGFTFEDYKRLCAPRTNFMFEESYLDELVTRHGILDKKDGVYSVNEKFFRILATFIN